MDGWMIDSKPNKINLNKLKTKRFPASQTIILPVQGLISSSQDKDPNSGFVNVFVSGYRNQTKILQAIVA